MTTITTRSGKGSPLTNAEVDANFTNLNTDKLELTVRSTTSNATLTPASDDTQYIVTALAVNATISAPSGTPVNGHKLLLRIKDNGTSRTLTWNAIYRALGVTLHTATTASKVLYIGCSYNSTAVKWDVIAVSEEA